MCASCNKKTSMKSIRFEKEPLVIVDLGKTPLAFEHKKRAGSMSSFDTADDSSTPSTSARRYRRERQKSSRDLHKTFAQAA
mmetsp:Transcript_4818/g.9899  ORF Transcript_4818/g.9899 Transcript_4818/m.9899 type:complete len:81 (+) Transcript_4818:128-370(+)